MPFLKAAGLDSGVPKFDFSVPGVTSISCDIVSRLLSMSTTVADPCSTSTLSAPRVCADSPPSPLPDADRTGSSVIMYHTPELRRYQYYVMTDWTGGVYASPSMAGSRPGAILAGAWAVMNHIGAE